DAAEHRYRRSGRRAAAGYRMGRQDRRAFARSAALGGDHLLLDAATFLGALTSAEERLRRRQRADAASDAWREGDARAHLRVLAAACAARCHTGADRPQ